MSDAAKTEKPITVDKWDGNAVKNALDDASKKIMKEKYSMLESYRLIDGRLSLSTLAVLCAAFAVAWDYLYPFPQSKSMLIFCVVAYFILTCLLSLYIMFYEKNTFYVGLEKDKAGCDPDNKWIMSSTLKRYDDKYTLSVAVLDGTNHQVRTASIERSVADFFDTKGGLRVDLFNPIIEGLKEDLSKGKKIQ